MLKRNEMHEKFKLDLNDAPTFIIGEKIEKLK